MPEKDNKGNLREEAKKAERAYHQFIGELEEGENPYAFGSAVSWAKDAITSYKKLGDEAYAKRLGEEVINTLGRYEEEERRAIESSADRLRRNEGSVSNKIKFSSALTEQHSKDFIKDIQKAKKTIEDLVGGKSQEGVAGKVLASIGIAGLLGGLYFLSNNLTGNVISNLNQTSSNWIGGVLFIIGLVGAFAYFGRR